MSTAQHPRIAVDAAGMSEAEILAEHPHLGVTDTRAAAYAAEIVARADIQIAS